MRSFERCRVSPVTSRICEALIGSRRFACLLWARDAPSVIRCRRMSPGHRAVRLLATLRGACGSSYATLCRTSTQSTFLRENLVGVYCLSRSALKCTEGTLQGRMIVYSASYKGRKKKMR